MNVKIVHIITAILAAITAVMAVVNPIIATPGLPAPLTNWIIGAIPVIIVIKSVLTALLPVVADTLAPTEEAHESVVAAKDAALNPVKTALILLLCAVIAMGGSSCSTLQSEEKKVTASLSSPQAKKVEAIAAKVGLDVGFAYLTGGSSAAASWAIPVAVDSLVGVVGNLSNPNAAAALQLAVNDFTADPNFKDVASKVAQVYITANPITPADKQATAAAISAVIANQLSSASDAITN